MKKISFILLLAVITVFTGCKKGENDPFLSLTSRTKRVLGEWTCTSMTNYYTYDDGESYYEESFDGTKTVKTDHYTNYLGQEVTNVDTVTNSITVTFNENGTFESYQEESYSEGSIDYVTKRTTSGYWYWNQKNEALGFDKKEVIVLHITAQDVEYISSIGNISTTTTQNYTMDGNDAQVMYYQLDRLTGDEMVVKMTGIETYKNNDDDTEVDNSTYEAIYSKN
jgi:hypothetical protein